MVTLGERDWLAKFLDLTKGIPSHGRFNTITRVIDPARFEHCSLG